MDEERRGSRLAWMNGVCPMPGTEDWPQPASVLLPLVDDFSGVCSPVWERERAVWHLVDVAQRSGGWTYVMWPRLAMNVLRRLGPRHASEALRSGRLLTGPSELAVPPERTNPLFALPDSVLARTLPQYRQPSSGEIEEAAVRRGVTELVEAGHVVRVSVPVSGSETVDAFGLARSVVDLVCRKFPDPFQGLIARSS